MRIMKVPIRRGCCEVSVGYLAQTLADSEC